MILVLVGTIKIQFNRPLIEIENLVNQGGINEDVIIQSGFTEFNSNNNLIKVFDFISPKKVEELYKEARLIISHGGTGSVISGLKKGKKIIVVPRLRELDEHVDNHQLELVEQLYEEGYILKWGKDDKLSTKLQELETFEPKVYLSNKEGIIRYLNNYIRNN